MEMEEKLRLAVDALIGGVDKGHLRILRKESFLCAAKCCDSADSHENLQTCVDTCQRKVSEAETLLGAELQQFQGRLQRCVLACRDEAEAQAPPTLDEVSQAKVQAKVDACALKCVDDQIVSLGPMKKRLDAGLSKLH